MQGSKEAPMSKPGSRQRAAPGRRCWTCIDRKVRCDRSLPACATCARSKRICHGYGLRLSWPREDDNKRFAVGLASDSQAFYHPANFSALHMVHTTNRDIELYRTITMYRYSEKQPIYSSLPWALSRRPADEKGLFQYFQYVMAPTMKTLNNESLGPILIRLALLETSPSGHAIQQAILALASLHQNGLHREAAELKHSSIKALLAATTGGIDYSEIVHHVTATMILCAYEILHHFISPNTFTDEWLWYVTSAKNLVSSVPIDIFRQEVFLLPLIEWVYHQETTSMFARLHWRPRRIKSSRYSKMGLATTRVTLHEDATPRSQHHALQLLSKVCNTLRPSSDPVMVTDTYKAQVATLRQQAEHSWTTSRVSKADLSTAKVETRSLVVTELYHLSTLIYLYRASETMFITDPKRIASWAERGFLLLDAVGTCDRTLPLIIIGAEAATDEARIAILEILETTSRQQHVRFKHCLSQFLHALWNQDDLHAERDLRVDYVEKLTAVVSRLNVPPPFE
ncbi:fungal-specific transcription factor domain-containing protein [Xylariaceae sp. FL1272]|nr:fungal-specific transcription factor domain-containing protein [Xylariaceae sp. FL1272]